MTLLEHTPVKTYCNRLAIERGLDPAGYAGSFDDAVLIEVPLPWPRSVYQQPDPLPQEMLDLLALWMEEYQQTGDYRHRPLLIAPDEEYSKPGFRRVMFYARGEGEIAQFRKTEYRIPETEVGSLLWAWFSERGDLPRFESYRAPETDQVRDLLVCTHGTIDAACAKFGYPLYRTLRDRHARADLRVWRVSHFGGHVFAPTLMDMPSGRYWAYVEDDQARQIVEASGSVSDLRGHYRGWAGLQAGFMQAAERELWQRHGWAWFGYHKAGLILAQDENTDEPAWAEVQITCTTPDGIRGAWEARVEISRHVETITTTGHTDTHRYPQYVVTRLQQTAQAAADIR
jgi:hypothetical protein